MILHRGAVGVSSNTKFLADFRLQTESRKSEGGWKWGTKGSDTGPVGPPLLRVSWIVLISHRKKQDEKLPGEDLRTKFYERYRELAEGYDKDFMKKYEEDLDTTLIFVCCPHRSGSGTCIDSCHRPVCSPPSLPPSSSRSTPSSSLIQTKIPPLSSV